MLKFKDIIVQFVVTTLKQNLQDNMRNYCNFSNETKKKRSISVREISWYPFCKLKELYHIFFHGGAYNISRNSQKSLKIIIDKKKKEKGKNEEKEESYFI